MPRSMGSVAAPHLQRGTLNPGRRGRDNVTRRTESWEEGQQKAVHHSLHEKNKGADVGRFLLMKLCFNGHTGSTRLDDHFCVDGTARDQTGTTRAG